MRKRRVPRYEESVSSLISLNGFLGLRGAIWTLRLEVSWDLLDTCEINGIS